MTVLVCQYPDGKWGEASSIKKNWAIRWYSWGFWWLFASDDIKYKLAKKVNYSWLHRYQRHTVTPSNTQNYSKKAANDIHDIQFT